MREIRLLSKPKKGGRVDTGPVQFGDDWPGVFIRGDEARYWGGLVNKQNQPFDVRVAELVTLLHECDLNYRRTRDRAARLANRPYQIIVEPDETTDGHPWFCARVKECPGCLGDGETYEAAVNDAREVLIEWISICLEDSQPIPEPELLKYALPQTDSTQ